MAQGTIPDSKAGRLVYRQTRWTRITHACWAVCLFFLLSSGLQIFNAHPVLYVGQESGFEYDNSILRIGTREEQGIQTGYLRVLGAEAETTGFLGFSDGQARAFPSVLTIPSYQSLAAGRVIHFFFAWVLVGTLSVWLLAGIVSGHVRRDLLLTRADLAALPRDIADHARLRFHRRKGYGALQKGAYAGVLFILLPLMVLTGLCMSPAFTAVAPWFLDLLGGRQTARTIHFGVMLLLSGFFAVHMIMILAAGPLNELRSIITGWYRIDREGDA